MTLIVRASDACALSKSQRRFVASPARFDGTLAELLANYIEPNLPPVESVMTFHRQLVAYVERPDPLFLVRAVGGTERRHTYVTGSGVHFRATDNAPAWWVFATLAHGLDVADEAFDAVIRTIPAHMFDIRLTAPPTARDAGWHIAHLFDVKDGGTKYAGWTRSNLVGRFIRSVHPANYFLLPHTDWQAWGGDHRVLGFFLEYYASRFQAIWPEFIELARADASKLPRIVGPIAYSIPQQAKAPVSHTERSATRLGADSAVSVEYTASRLTFRRDVIEPLANDALFRVICTEGTFEMTKAQFHRAFPGVVASRSYRMAGRYNYPKAPSAAGQFRVS